MNDVDENAVLVNALQRHATVVTQKSLAEGLGLTVAEAMWKSRAMIGSAVGGIPDQIAEGTGLRCPIRPIFRLLLIKCAGCSRTARSARASVR